MSKETIKIADYEEEESLHQWKNFEVMQETTLYTDLENGATDVEAIIRRISDGKFFRFEYYSSVGYSNELEQEAEEVEMKTRTITETYYE